MDGNSTWLILDQISSSKIKDRNAGLQELQGILKDNPALILKDSIKQLLSVLVRVFEAELDSYCSALEDNFAGDATKKLDLIANRLSAISYTIRLLIGCKVSQCKFSQLKFAIGALQNALFYGKQIIEPIMIDVMHTLLTITKSDVFLLRLSPSLWLDMIKLNMRIISNLIKAKNNSRALIDSLDMLHILLNHETYQIKNVGRELRNLIISCIKSQKKETTITLVLVSIVTTLVAKTNCDDIYGCKLLIKEVWELYLRIGGTNNEGIRKEFCYLDFFGGQLFCSSVPSMHGQENIIKELDDIEVMKTLLQTYITRKYEEYDINTVNLDLVTLINRSCCNCFLEFNTFSIVEESFPWLCAYSFYYLCETYFFLCQSEKGSDEFGLFKRAKFENEFISRLVHSSSLVNFMNGFLLESQDIKNLVLGYQLSIFYYNMIDSSVESDKIEPVIKNIGRDEITNWALLCLIGILSKYKANNSNGIESKVVQLLLPLVKSEKSSQYACYALSLAFQLPSLVLKEEDFETSIKNILTFPSINGPAILSFESLNFWNGLYVSAKDSVKLSHQSYCISIVSWMCSKWENNNFEAASVVYFELCHLLGLRDGLDILAIDRNSIKWGMITSGWKKSDVNFDIWRSSTEGRDFLLDKKRTLFRDSVLKYECLHYQELHNIDEQTIIDGIIKLRDSSKGDEQLLSLLLILVDIIERLKGIEYDSILVEMKAIVNDILLETGLLSKVGWDKYRIILSVVSRFHNGNKLRAWNHPFLLKHLDNMVQSFCQEHSTYFSTEAGVKGSDLNMLAISKRTNRNLGTFHRDLKMLITISIKLESCGENSFSTLIHNVLIRLSKEDMLDVIAVILICLESEGKTLSPTILDDLSQLFAGVLLSSTYQYSDITIEFLSRFLLVSKDVWIQSRYEALNSDCNDILSWVVQGIKEDNFGSLSSLSYCSKLLIALLDISKTQGALIRFNKQQIYSVLLTSMKRLPVTKIYQLLPDLSFYMQGKSYKNQVTVISDLKDFFDPIPQGVENAAFFCLSMVTLASRSSVNLVYLISELTQYFEYEHVHEFVKRGIGYLVTDIFDGKVETLLNICKYTILIQYVSNCENTTSSNSYFRKIISEIFNIESETHFLKKYMSDIIAILVSTGDRYKLCDKLQNISMKDKRTLILESIPVLIPISLYSHGLEEGVFQFLKENISGDLEKEIDTQYLMILKSMISFMDLGTFSYVADPLLRVQLGGELLKSFVKNDINLPNYKYPISINPEVGILILQKHTPNRKSVINDLKIQILWTLSDIQNSNSFLQTIKLLREVQFLLLYFWTEFSKSSLLFDFLNWMSYFLKYPDIANYVFELLKRVFIMLNPELMENDKTLTPFFLNVYSYADKIGLSEKNFSDIEHLISKRLKLSTICSFCCNVLVTKTVSRDVYSLISAITDGPHFQSELEIFGLILAKAPSFDINNDEIGTNYAVASFLYSCEDLSSFSSVNFSIWFANFISQQPQTFYDIETTKADTEGNGNEVDYVELVFEMSEDNFKRLFTSVFSFFNSEKASTDFSFVLLSQIVSILLIRSKDFEQFCEIYDKNENLTFHDDTTPNFNESMLKLFSPDYQYQDSLLNLQDIIFSKTSDYQTWLAQLNYHLLTHISLNFPYVLLLRPLCGISLKFSEYISRILFLSALHVDSRRIIPDWSDIINNLKVLHGTVDGFKKMGHILNFLKVIRVGYRQKIKVYRKFYSKIQINNLVEVSLLVRDSKFALLLFEEVTMASGLSYDSLQLKSIYESIGDISFLSGLPAPTTLQGVISSLNNIEPYSEKTLKLNSAYFDATYREGAGEGLSNLINSLSNRGFYGIADALCSNPENNSKGNAYEWSLQLGLWKLPMCEKPDSKEKVFYNLLRDLNSKKSSILVSIENSLINSIKCKQYFNQDIQWYETIREHIVLRNVYSRIHDGSATGFPKNLIQQDKEILKYSDYSSYRKNLQCRYHFANFMSQLDWDGSKYPHCIILPAFELLTQAKFTIEHNFVQDSLSNIMQLEKMIPKIDDADEATKQTCVRALKYVTALTLWKSKESKASISLLSELLSSDKNSNRKYEPFVTTDEIQSQLIWQSFESKVKTGTQIFETYIDNWEIDVSYIETSAKVLFETAIFLDAEIKRLTDSDQLAEKERSYFKTKRELQDIERLVKTSGLANEDIVEGQKHYHNLKTHMANDFEAINNIRATKKKLTVQTLLYYIQILLLSSDFDDDVLDRFCGLWFENDEDDDINSILSKRIAQIPTWKYLPWVNQLTSKLSLKKSIFQKQLWAVLKRLLYKLPYDSGYAIINMKMYERYHDRVDVNIEEKITAANHLIKQIRESKITKEPGQNLTDILEFCEQTLNLAEMKVKGKNTRINLDCLEIGKYWLEELKKKNLPLPTVPMKVVSSDQYGSGRDYIVKVSEKVEVTSTGLSLPKIVTFTLSNGQVHKVVIKYGNDDLRQDAIMEQVFQQVNKIIRKDREMRKQQLHIRTYNVIPLGPKSGMIEFVNNSLSLHSILSELHSSDDYTWLQARRAMKDVQSKSDHERILTYLEITTHILPQLRNFFFNSFMEPHSWYQAKKKYIKGVAASSIVGHILGLGDRHLNNILIDTTCGEPVHIDLGIAFDQGKMLRIPELVPFRLTRDIVDGFGITGVEGLFRKTCENVLALLGRDAEKVMCILNILKWDPLYSWAVSPFKKYRHLIDEGLSEPDKNISDKLNDLSKQNYFKKESDENQQSYRALKGVKDKLEHNGLSVEATVEELIHEATDESKLALIFNGWSPFF